MTDNGAIESLLQEATLAWLDQIATTGQGITETDDYAHRRLFAAVAAQLVRDGAEAAERQAELQLTVDNVAWGVMHVSPLNPDGWDDDARDDPDQQRIEWGRVARDLLRAHRQGKGGGTTLLTTYPDYVPVFEAAAVWAETD